MATYAVVTRVPNPDEGDNGNLALGQAWVDPQATGGNYSDPPIPLVNVSPALMLWIRLPVFKVGEILVMPDGERDQFGRKPSKWDVDLYESESISDVLVRLDELRRADLIEGA